MDIIQAFSRFANVRDGSVRREILNSPEVRIARKYKELDDHLGKLRSQTTAYSYIYTKGTLKVREDPALDELQRQIRGEEARLQRLREIADEMGAILESHKAAGVYELQEIKGNHQTTITYAPGQAWHLFRLARGEGSGGPRNRTSWLPSDLVQEPTYKAEEDRLREGIEAAKAALVPIEASLQKLGALVAEATGL